MGIRMKVSTSLTNRIFFASASLAVLCIVFAIYLINVRVTRESEAQVRRGLVEAGALVDQHRRLFFENFALIARLIADLPKLKAAVATEHAPTVLPIAADYQAQAGSDIFVVLDRRGSVLADLGSGGMIGAEVRDVQEALAGREARGFLPHPSGLLHVVTVPLVIGSVPPDVLGALSLGFLLSDRLAGQLRDLTGSEIAFVDGDHVLASTLQRRHDAELARVPKMPGIVRLWLDDQEYVSLSAPLAEPAVGAGGAWPSAVLAGEETVPGSASVVILRSQTERLQFLRPLHTALAGTAALAVLLATVLSYAVARTVTRPVAAITASMRELAATGDLARKTAVPSGRWVDEDARLLARTFNALTDSIARFQREEAQRERLSSLGRLSTVIAHEVRNPLMIVKASVRTLRRQPAPPEEAREAIDDIEEEVNRLNSIVNDVLDFARPIRFDLSPGDVNAIVADAAAASSAADGGIKEIRLSLAPALPIIVTDGERLRRALVNVMSNARDAVRARREAASREARERDGEPGIEVVTWMSGSDAICVAVRDRGIGIDTERAHRLFEPFFTTRRGGTGLGLPIARNIIEGLGGTIAIAAWDGGGTEIRIEMPAGSSGEEPVDELER
jgi:signal transduction histidine kinase